MVRDSTESLHTVPYNKLILKYFIYLDKIKSSNFFYRQSLFLTNVILLLKKTKFRAVLVPVPTKFSNGSF